LPSEISFQDVIEALEGPIAINVCMDPHMTCGHLSRCTMVGIWSELQRKIIDVFTRTTLADLQGVPCAIQAGPSSLSGAA
jgi:DNA-binding IscR family transcriptional regulator